MVTESSKTSPDAHRGLISCQNAPASVQESISVYLDRLPDKTFQCNTAFKTHSVSFFMHNSILTSSWRVKSCKNGKNGLVAALELMAASRPLAFHNLYKNVKKLKADELFALLGLVH
jgi:hypothetical protein